MALMRAGADRDAVMMEASIGMSIFLEDGASYDKAMGIFLNRGTSFPVGLFRETSDIAPVPEYVYLLSDGPNPVLPPGKTVANFWNGMRSGNFKADGISQETCSCFLSRLQFQD